MTFPVILAVGVGIKLPEKTIPPNGEMKAGTFGVEFLVIVSSKRIIVNLKTPEDAAAAAAFGGGVRLMRGSKISVLRSQPNFIQGRFKYIAQYNGRIIRN